MTAEPEAMTLSVVRGRNAFHTLLNIGNLLDFYRRPDTLGPPPLWRQPLVIVSALSSLAASSYARLSFRT